MEKDRQANEKRRGDWGRNGKENKMGVEDMTGMEDRGDSRLTVGILAHVCVSRWSLRSFCSSKEALRDFAYLKCKSPNGERGLVVSIE